MAKQNLNTDNALMFGSDDDSLYLANYGQIVTLDELGFDDDIPTLMVDCGWIDNEGFGEALSDSAAKIRGHQGNKIVKAYVSESETSLTATLLETKLATFEWYYNTKGVRVTTGSKSVGKFVLPTGRKAIELCGITDLIDTSSGWRMRKIYPHLTLTERDSVAFKIGDITAYKVTLDVIDDPILITDVPSMIPTE